MKPEITSKTVEQALASKHESARRSHPEIARWPDDYDKAERRKLRADMRAALEATAPAIYAQGRAQGLEEAAERICPAHRECCDPERYDRGECCGEFISAQAAIRKLKEAANASD